MISISKSYVALKLNFRVFFFIIRTYAVLLSMTHKFVFFIESCKLHQQFTWLDITLEIILISLLKSYWYHYNIAITDDNIILMIMNYLMRTTQITRLKYTRLKYSRILYTFPSAPQKFGHIRIYTPRILIRKAFPKC